MIYFASIPIRPQAKERPRFGKGRCFMSQRYTDWRKEFVVLARGWRWLHGDATGFHAPPHIAGRYDLEVFIYTKSGLMKPDSDNAGAAINDALQDAGIVANDRNNRDFIVQVRKQENPGITITIREIEPC